MVEQYKIHYRIGCAMPTGTLSIGTGKEEWGAVPGKEYYRFHIEQIGQVAGIEKEDAEHGN